MDKPRRLLSIGTDRMLFREDSAVRARIREYAKNWDELHTIVFAGKEYSEDTIAPNAFVYSTRSWSKFLYPFDAIRLGRFIVKRRDITNITCEDSSLTAMAGISLKKAFNIPVELQLHTDVGSPYFGHTFFNKVRKSMALAYLPKADSIRVVSERIKQYLIKELGISESKITVRPINVPVEEIKNTSVKVDLHKKYPEFDKIVLMCSRLEAEKNIDLALRAWPEILEKNPKAGLVIVGSGSQDGKLKSLTKSLDISNSVKFESWTAKDILYSYYKTADAFLNTSLFEGYGMTLVEAQAAGTKIVSTDVGVAKDVGAIIINHTKDDVIRGITAAIQV